ncbi:MAG: ABC transporter permease [Chloroflexi bacterium]|nr:ABC transporter permease [Chloroflexota bacterium]
MNSDRLERTADAGKTKPGWARAVQLRSLGSPPGMTRRSSAGLWRILSLPLLLFLLLPLTALLIRTPLDQIALSLTQEQVHEAIALSFGTTLVSAVLIVVFGTPVAYLLAMPRTRLERILDTVVDLPTVLPPSVAGIALLLAFGRRGLLGPVIDVLGVHVAFTSLAVVLAQTFVASPFYIKSAAIAFAGIDTDLLQAAALDGAGNRQIFRHITVPLAWAGLVSGLVMSWARALGEFGATILFAGNLQGVTQTMPLAIYIGFEVNLDTAVTLSVILLALSFTALLLAKALLSRAR